MAIQRLYYEVEFYKHDDQDAGPVYLDRIEVGHADQMRGELEAGKNGLPRMDRAPIATTTTWVYCALVRLGHYKGRFQQFAYQDLIGFEQIKDANGKPETEDVDPTGEPSPYDWPSLEPSPARPTG